MVYCGMIIIPIGSCITRLRFHSILIIQQTNIRQKQRQTIIAHTHIDINSIPTFVLKWCSHTILDLPATPLDSLDNSSFSFPIPSASTTLTLPLSIPTICPNSSSCVITISWKFRCWLRYFIIATNDSTRAALFSLSRFVVGSSNAKIPQCEQNVSANAIRITSDARAFCPAEQRPRICSFV